MIRINNKYYIDADSKNYILKLRTLVQDTESPNFGKETFKDLGYYTTLESLLNGILKADTREFIAKEDVKSITELKEYIKECKDFISNLNLNF